MKLKDLDPKIYSLVAEEIARQKRGLVLIPSENYASLEVLAALATPLNNKYSEGYPGKRYYSGNKFIDEIENIAVDRATKLFKAEHANVQPHSGSQANAAVYLALLKPGDKVLGIDLNAGGHLTHGSLVNFSGKTYNFSCYGVNRQTEMIDYEEIKRQALEFKPKLIITSTTSYSRTLDFKKFREIADEVKAYLLADISHIAGLVVAGVHPHPFPFADIVTTTTHKTLRGPRGALILCKEKDRLDGKSLAKKIDKAVFPGTQGGPMDHVIAAKAVCFLLAMEPSFSHYQEQVVFNAKVMAEEFLKQGIRVVSGGTDNHLMVIDVSSVGSQEVQDRLEQFDIYVNRNVIPFDKRPPLNPSGIRLGTPAITTRGFKEEESREVAKLIINAIKGVDQGIAFKVKELCEKFPIYEDLQW